MRLKFRVLVAAVLVAALAAPVIAQWTVPERTPTFNDVPAYHPNFEVIEGAVHLGWFSGYPDGDFQPDRTITGKQMGTVLTRIFPQGMTREAFASLLWNHYWIIAGAGGDATLQQGRQLLQQWRNNYIYNYQYQEGLCANQFKAQQAFLEAAPVGQWDEDTQERYTAISEDLRRCECSAFTERAAELQSRSPAGPYDRAQYVALYRENVDCFIGPRPAPPTIVTTTSTTTTTVPETTTTAAPEPEPEATTTTEAEPEPGAEPVAPEAGTTTTVAATE